MERMAGPVFCLDSWGEQAYSDRNRTTLDAFEEWVPTTRSFASPDQNDQKIMTNDLVALIEFYEKEKSIEREKVVEALENAFLSAYRRMVPGAEDIEELRAEVDTKQGETRIFATLRVVADDDHQDKFNEVPISLASRKNPEVQLNDPLEFNVTPKNFGRIAVQTAKQTMMQRLRQAEKEMIYDEFKDRAGDIVSGAVRRFEKNDVMVDLGKFEARMPSRERVSTEDYNIGDRIRAYGLRGQRVPGSGNYSLPQSPEFRATAL
jgi:N utilization substance protein A